MPDITMSVDETLELDEIIEEWSRSDSNLSFNGDKDSFNLSGIQTKTSIINPQQPGTYTITVNGRELSVEVIGTNAIPDTSVDRPVDNDTATLSQPFGAVISVSQDWLDFDCRISSNTSGLTTAYLFDSDSNLITDIDVSSAVAGDVVTFVDVNLSANNNYRILADADGSDYDLGHRGGPSFPYQSDDGNLEIVDAIEGSGGGSSTSPIGNFVEFGNLS